ncbi:MAG: RNA 2',3'-cyclic phosphodiesterase [Candidatus Nanoarchaeia archaeon]|nr:RNA 2',3'-cyclic phosphodiesterase [Candidatus Nanoarchaeia archaeon]
MRCFIAFEVSDEAKQAFAEAQSQLDKENTKLKLTKDFHLTLKFLGEIDENKAEEVKSKLNEIKFNPFETSLTDIGVFPDENYIRVIWIGLDDKENKIKNLQKQIDETLNEIGFKEDKRFHPHITLARVKFTKDKEDLLKNLKQIKFNKKSFNVNEFKLKKSTLTKEGPFYEDIAVFKV